MTYNEILALMRLRRKELKLTQEEMADKLFISASAYARYENGSRYMQLATMLAACEILGIPLEFKRGDKEGK